jgi:hypothetical protein
LLDLFDTNEFQISEQQFPTHFSPAGNGEVPNIMVHKTVRVSINVVSNILDLDNVPIVFQLLDLLRTNNPSDPVDKFTDWQRFQNLTSEIISPRIQINSGTENEKAAGNFIFSTA